MKIVLLSGSPRVEGNTNILVKEFIRGAKESGHSVYSFDCAHHTVGGCRSCNFCLKNGSCIQKDDFELMLKPQLLEADAIVLVTPIYYFTMTSQIKTVIDRFYGLNPMIGNIRSKKQKAILITVQGQPSESISAPLMMTFQYICDFFNWQDAGQIHATNVLTPGSIVNTDYVNGAYLLGKNLK